MLAIHATTAALSGVTYLKKKTAVILLTPISNKSKDGSDDCTKNKILTNITKSAKLIVGISHKNMIKY